MNQEKIKKWDISYLKMALILSTNSYAVRRKVGCLIVKDRMIISDGINGMPNGLSNNCEDEIFDDCSDFDLPNVVRKDRLITKDEVVHAEQNALMKCAKRGMSCADATIYISDAPCINCSKLLIQSGIKRVVYARDYRCSDGIELLRKAKIEVVKIDVS